MPPLHTSPDSLPASLSIIIPARDEEHYLPLCMKAIKHSANISKQKNICNEIEIVVVNNRSTDKTKEIAQLQGATVIDSEAKNLSCIRNTGVKHASHEYIITIDADSVMSDNMITSVIQSLHNQKIVGGGVMMYPERYSLGIICTGLALLPIALKHRISAGLFFFRRTDFHAIDGFNEAMFSAEDIDFAKRLRAYGKNDKRRYTTLLRSYITTSTRKFDHFGDWYFLKNYRTMIKLLEGNDQKSANKIWYDFKH